MLIGSKSPANRPLAGGTRPQPPVLAPAPRYGPVHVVTRMRELANEFHMHAANRPGCTTKSSHDRSVTG